MGPSYPCRIVLEWTASSQMSAALSKDRCVLLLLLLLLCKKKCRKDNTHLWACNPAMCTPAHTLTHTHTHDTPPREAVDSQQAVGNRRTAQQPILSAGRRLLGAGTPLMGGNHHSQSHVPHALGSTHTTQSTSYSSHTQHTEGRPRCQSQVTERAQELQCHPQADGGGRSPPMQQDSSPPSQQPTSTYKNSQKPFPHPNPLPLSAGSPGMWLCTEEDSTGWQVVAAQLVWLPYMQGWQKGEHVMPQPGSEDL